MSIADGIARCPQTGGESACHRGPVSRCDELSLGVVSMDEDGDVSLQWSYAFPAQDHVPAEPALLDESVGQGDSAAEVCRCFESPGLAAGNRLTRHAEGRQPSCVAYRSALQGNRQPFRSAIVIEGYLHIPGLGDLGTLSERKSQALAKQHACRPR